MSARDKPVLGYATRSDAACDLREQGLRPVEIARAIGATSNSVGNLIRQGYRRVAKRKLVEEAARRGMTVAELRGAIVIAVVDDNLIDAVLDTGGADGAS